MQKSILFFVALFLTSLLSAPLCAETMTMSTFVASPTGEYQTIRLHPHDEPSLTGCDEGRMYIDTSGNLQICQDDGMGSTIYGFMSGTWKQTGDNIYPTATASNSHLLVGIGTQNPATKLHVQSSDDFKQSIVRFENTADDIDLFVTSATPEGSVTGNTGDLAVDASVGALYIKTSNASATDWKTVGAGGACGDVAQIQFNVAQVVNSGTVSPMFVPGSTGWNYVPLFCNASVKNFTVVCPGTDTMTHSLVTGMPNTCSVTTTGGLIPVGTDCSGEILSTTPITISSAGAFTAGKMATACSATITVEFQY